MRAITMVMKSPSSCYKILIITVCMVLQVVEDRQLVCGEKVGGAAASCIDKERRALLQFKAGLVDDYDMLSSWSTDHGDCCQWERVSCNNRTGHVHSLHLHGEYDYSIDQGPYLSGRIHTSLIELQQLHYLNLSSNDFRDIHIPQFFGSMSNLRYLDLSGCNFVGKIPSQLGSLPHLKYLNLRWNELEGSIPYQLGNLSKLQYLDLGLNYLQGRVPSQLGNLSRLQELYLGGSNNGALELDGGNEWLSSLTSLTHLDLSRVLKLNTSHNWLQMIGKLPKLRELTLTECGLSDLFILSFCPSMLNFSTSLSILDLSGNSFTSFKTIFQWVSNIGPNLVELDLNGNTLEGSGSSHFGIVMNSLERLNLHDNRLKDGGDLIKSFMNMCTLLSLNVRRNNLIEDLPSILHNLSAGCVTYSLEELDLSENQITGTLSDLSIFSSLKTFDLSSNRLSGKIPEGIKLPPKLESLLIYSNSLEGGIPKSFGNTCTLASLDLSDNRLSIEFSVIIHHLSGCARYSLKELFLEMNQINGTLRDLSMFSALTTLDLSENQLNGKITEESRLPPLLESLSIASNFFEGGIPKSFGNTCRLSSLDFSYNTLGEELPMIVYHLSGCTRNSLKELDLSINRINGTLPDFSMFPFLKYLRLFNNMLNGKILEDIRLPSQLEKLDISSNCLKGVITDSHLANVSKLRWLDFSDNSVAFVFSQNWIPPFQLEYLGLRSCQLGPHFPKWLQTQNQLREIDISNAGISDIVPEWFWSNLLGFDGFASINISYNNLTGTIPNLPLKSSDYSLSLASNQFEGPIPAFLRGAFSLDLSKNKFSDCYSFICANVTSETLGQLDLSNNHLSGQIPNCWSYSKSLAYIDLSHNKFSGKIPISMGSLLELQALILRNNNLSEEISSSMKSCTKLKMLDVTENELSGHIPSWIGRELQELQFLSLQRNRFSGSLPLQLCYLQSAQLIDLSFNNLSGQIPKCINNFTLMAQMTFSRGSRFHPHSYYVNISSMTRFTGYYDLNAILMWKGAEQKFMNNELSLLKSIDFSSNQLSGGIPTEIEDLLGLVSLNLSRNNLTGEIPSNIGNLTSLEFLDMSRNQLSGQIPSSLTQIDRLAILDVSHNHLSGRIPTGTQLQSFDPSRYEDNLDLCGKPLEKLCMEGESPRVQEEEHKAAFANAFYLSMGVGFAVGFLGIFGSILVRHSWRHAYFRFLNNITEDIYVITAIKVNKYKRWLRG